MTQAVRKTVITSQNEPPSANAICAVIVASVKTTSIRATAGVPPRSTRLITGPTARKPKRIVATLTTAKQTTGLMEAGTYYWHFVDVVWVIIFIVVYLL